MTEYWQLAVRDYVREKRKTAEKHQKEMTVSRKTVSSIENAKSNPTLATLLKVLAAIDGNVSEVFQSNIPKELHKSDRVWHEMLQIILGSGDPDRVQLVQHALSDAFALTVRIHPDEDRRSSLG